MGYIVTEAEINMRMREQDAERRAAVKASLLAEKKAAREKTKSDLAAARQNRDIADLEAANEKKRLALEAQGVLEEWRFKGALNDLGFYAREEGVTPEDKRGDDSFRLYLSTAGYYFLTIGIGTDYEATHQIRQFEREINMGRPDCLSFNNDRIRVFVHASLGNQLNNILMPIGTSDTMDVPAFG